MSSDNPGTSASFLNIYTELSRPTPMDEHDAKEKRKEQNRVAQRKYRRKLAEQARESNNLAKQARLMLKQLATGRLLLQRCPHCDHCRALNPLELPDVNVHESLGDKEQQNWDQNITVEETAPDIPFLDEDFSTIFPGSAGILDTLPSNLTRRDSHRPSEDDHTKNDCGNVFEVESRSSVGMMTSSPTTIRGSPTTSIPTRMSSQAEAAMFQAADRGHTAMVKILLSSGAGIDSPDSNGRTALFHAAYSGHVETVKALLIAGSNPSTTDFMGTSVLLAAVTQGHEQVVEALVSMS